MAVFRKIIIFTSLIATLSGCSAEEAIEKGQGLLESGETLLEQGEELADQFDEASAKVKEIAATFDTNILQVQHTDVYEEDFTFKELINATIENPEWTSVTDTYVAVRGQLKSNTVDLGEYIGLDEITLGFPFDESSGLALANAGVFTTIDGGARINGTAYELSGQEIIDILSMIYKAN